MSNTITLEMTLNEARVINALQRVIALQTKADTSTAKWGDEYKKAGKSAEQAAREVDRFAARANKIDAAPIEKYRKEVELLKKSLAQKLISPETFSRGMERAGRDYNPSADRKKALEEETRAADRTRDAHRRLNDETKRLTATPVEIYKNKMRELGAAFRSGAMDQQTFVRGAKAAKDEMLNAGAASKKVSEANEDTFGGMAVQKLASFATGLVSISAAVGVIKQGLELVAQAREKALGSSKSLDEANMELSSLAEGATDEERAKSYADILKQRDDYAKKYGLDRTVASRTLFNAKSAGFTEQETDTAMQAGLVTDSDAASLLMVKAKAAFDGEITGREALNVAMTAANKTQTDTKKLSTFLPTAMVSAKSAGFDYTETAALVAKGSDYLKGTEQAADRVSNLFAKMAGDSKYAGRGMAAIREINGDDAKREEFIGGSKELREALNYMRDHADKVDSLVKDLRTDKATTGTAEDAINRTVKIRLSNPAEAEKLQLRQDTQHAEIENEKQFARDEAKRSSAAAREQAYISRTKKGMGYRTGEWLYGGTARYLGFDDVTSSVIGRVGGVLGGMESPFKKETYQLPTQYAPAGGGVKDVLQIDALTEQRKQTELQQKQLATLEQLNSTVRDGKTVDRAANTAQRAAKERK